MDFILTQFSLSLSRSLARFLGSYLPLFCVEHTLVRSLKPAESFKHLFVRWFIRCVCCVRCICYRYFNLFTFSAHKLRQGNDALQKKFMGKLLHTSIFVRWLHSRETASCVFAKNMFVWCVCVHVQAMIRSKKALDRTERANETAHSIVWKLCQFDTTALVRMHIHKRSARKWDRFIRANRFEMLSKTFRYLHLLLAYDFFSVLCDCMYPHYSGSQQVRSH